MATYRALISIPIEADNDNDVMDVADAVAATINDIGGEDTGGAQVELVTEVTGIWTPVRTVDEDPHFRRQIPLASR